MKASELKTGLKIKVNEVWSEVKKLVNDGDVVHVEHEGGSFAITATQEIQTQVVPQEAPVQAPESQI